jgi:hypothetical protein
MGLEPSLAARAIAEANGVRVLGSAVENLDASGSRFGAATLIDVAEHLSDPMGALMRIVARLERKGLLVVFTGSTDSWSWRLAGIDYWYSALAEHVTFFCPGWFAWAAPRLGCTIKSVSRWSSNPRDLRSRMWETIANAAILSQRRLERRPATRWLAARLPFWRRLGSHRECWWTSARDHILVVLRKD